MSQDRRGATAASWAFRVALAGFLAASTFLAAGNRSPGSVDSCDNLSLARNLARGRGYTTRAVGQLWVRQSIPAEDTVRPPGLPFLLAATFRVAGESLAVPVLVNALAVAGHALLLRAAVGRITNRPIGDLAGLLVLASHDYELVSIWNNNGLALATSALLYLATRRPSAVPLAVVTALGFLLKPTFILGALPFSILLLLGRAGRTRGRRALDALGYLGVALALASPYWLHNLRTYGAPLYSPSFTSSRLALRYGVLGDAPWQTVRLGRPMTYGEVVARIGWPGLIMGDVKEIARTLYYTAYLNPTVATLAALLALFWRPERWRDYAGPLMLIGGVWFEVGAYNHHEFRYLWPIYPCLIFLAALGARDFEGWGVGQMTPALATRARRLLVALAAGGLVVGIVAAALSWRHAWEQARRPEPGWIAAVRGLPGDALILTTEVAAVAWWADRPALMAPVGPRGDLDRLLDVYPANYLLARGDDGPPVPGLALDLDALTLLDRGAGWRLFRLEPRKGGP